MLRVLLDSRLQHFHHLTNFLKIIHQPRHVILKCAIQAANYFVKLYLELETVLNQSLTAAKVSLLEHGYPTKPLDLAMLSL